MADDGSVAQDRLRATPDAPVRRLSGRGVTTFPGPVGRRRTRPPASPREAAAGTIAGTPANSAAHPRVTTARSAAPGRAPAYQAVALSPRLLDLPAAARYLSVSVWTIRDLEASGALPRVRLPLPHGGELRKLLFDREDLDRLVACGKAGPA
jgi:hypothetical protein